MNEKISVLNLSISNKFNFDEEGISVHQFYDMNHTNDDVGQEIKMSYQDVENTFFDCNTYKNEGMECINPDSDGFENLKGESEALLAFAKSVKKRLKKAVKNHNKRIKNS